MVRSLLSRHHLLALVLGVSGLLILAGCGGASAQPTGGASPGSTSLHATATSAHASGGPLSNICPLITPAQLQQITGMAFNAGIDVHPGGAPAPGETNDAHCGYQQTVNAYSNVGDSALWFNSTASADAFYTGLRTNYGSEGANPVDVSGVGDKAFAFRGGLFVLKSSVVFFVTYIVPTTHQADVSAETRIVQIVLPQL
jgi:hypothetical protein